MNNVICIIGMIAVMFIIVKVYIMLQEKAPLIEKFLEGPFAPFKKQGGTILSLTMATRMVIA